MREVVFFKEPMKSKALIVEIALVIFLCSQFMGAQNGKGYISG